MPTCRSTNGLALTPPELVTAHLKTDPQFIRALRKDKSPVVPA
jgi:oxalate decarboxylase